jgi:single-stranded-DNA-specific exonuclease
MTKISFVKRPFNIRTDASAQEIARQGIHPLMAKLGAQRGLTSAADFDYSLARLLAPQGMKNCQEAAKLLLTAIEKNEKLLVVADYDCDGATGCAVLVRGLRMMGAQVDYIVPNRFTHGYGLSPDLVAETIDHPRLGKPDWLITVDNGIASVDGIAKANELGMRVLVTDHHLPGPYLPAAELIVNPNQPGCPFPSKSIAGVGVALYVLLATRALLRQKLPSAADIALQNLLDLVALGTVADVVALDHNNRILVNAGLGRIRSGKACAGIRALFEVANKQWREASSSDLGFSIAPRINAAGRLQDIASGIECLLCDDPIKASHLAEQLGQVNAQRRELQEQMQNQADATLAAQTHQQIDNKVIVAFDEAWHEGLVGLVAGRLKEAHYKPCIAFAPSAADPQWLKGSGRSVNGVNLRDFLDLVTKTAPGLSSSEMPRFGGHAMAAGLTLHRDALQKFTEISQLVAEQSISPTLLLPTKFLDLSLEGHQLNIAMVHLLESQPWGAGFSEPLFRGEFEIVSQQLLQGKHSKLKLIALPKGVKPQTLNGIFFNHTDSMAGSVNLAFRLIRDNYHGPNSVQIMIESII